ncbi:MAG: hypothetical protein ACHP9Z_34830 [Streptosporangiales bacterium]
MTSYPPESGQHVPHWKLPQLTTYELKDYRRELESAIAFFDRQDPVPPARDRLQASLDAVVAEQDARHG